MIQLNLLPDVKLKYIKTKRTKRTVIGISLIVIVASVALFIFMFSFVNVAQRGHIARLEEDINLSITEVQNTKGLNEILTVQNQLNIVSEKHKEKPAADRILPYLSQFLPEKSKIATISTDFTVNSISFIGNTTSIGDTTKLVDSLKFAKYKTKSGAEGSPFISVVLSSYTADVGNSDFSINLVFDPIIFNNTEEITIEVPGIVSTRSSTEKPQIEFTEPVKIEETVNGQ